MSGAETTERAFYRAFTEADLEAMVAVWSEAEDISCAHPMRPEVRGREAVLQSWARLFASGERLNMRIEVVARWTSPTLVVQQVIEHLSDRDGNPYLPPMHATNVYRLEGESWKMVSHAAGPTGTPETAAAAGATTH